MQKIHLLEENLINRIAAGEVVDRPASVVKELVENAIDAGATQIDIELEDGGKNLIQIRDNGCGIGRDDLVFAVSRHATSKITELDDLFTISTLGFRGEALASIASVSKLTLTSKTADENAHQIIVDGGKLGEALEAGHPQGTTVLVQYLFQHTPARLKFLKSAETEMGHIVDDVIKEALVHPEIAFNLRHNGKKIINSPTSRSARSRIADLFDPEIEKMTYEVDYLGAAAQIKGFIGHPQISRSHNKNIYLYVNGRPVRDKVLLHAVSEGYRDLIMKGRYPFAVLNIRVPEISVDVNVHPAKTEVRFANSQVIHRAVVEAIRHTLEKEPWKSETITPSPQFQPSENQNVTAAFQTQNNFDSQARLFSPPERQKSFLGDNELLTTPNYSTQATQSEKRNIEFGKRTFAELNIIGQAMSTFIICQADDQLVLIDQHAAHERIGFEKLLKMYNEQSIASQQLLIPDTFDLLPSETEILKRIAPELDAFGFEVEHFGGNTFVVKSVPSLIADKISVKNMILDLIGDVVEKGTLTSLKDNIHHALATMACHGAIKANHRLTFDEMSVLIRDLDKYQFTDFCPHGRPVSVEVSRHEMEKWFKRII